MRRGARRAEKGQADCAVVALVRAVLDVGEDGGAEAIRFIGLVDPVMGGHLKLAVEGDGALDCADFPVVGGDLVC